MDLPRRVGDRTLQGWLLRRGAGVAAVGALLATLGDVGQLWVGNAARAELGLAAPPAGLIVPATLLGVLGIPLYALGYGARALSARERGRAAALVAASGAAFAALGATVHGVTGLVIAHGIVPPGLDPLEGILASGPIALWLWALAGGALVCAGVAELRLRPRLDTRALANPLVLTVLIAAASPLLGLPLRDFVGPASANLAHLAFFAALARSAA
jgi:hypothetical protein